MSSGFTPCIYVIYAIDLIQYNKFDIIYKTFVRMYVRREIPTMSPSTIILSIMLAVIVLVVAATGFDNANAMGAKVQALESQAKTHEYTLVAEETTLEIAPNVRVDAWTYKWHNSRTNPDCY